MKPQFLTTTKYSELIRKEYKESLYPIINERRVCIFGSLGSGKTSLLAQLASSVVNVSFIREQNQKDIISEMNDPNTLLLIDDADLLFDSVRELLSLVRNMRIVISVTDPLFFFVN